MSEIFDEVDEEVRREQLRKLWERYSGLIVALAVLIVAAVGGWRGYQWYEARRAAEASAAFEAAVALADQNKPAEAETAFNKVAENAPRGYRTLARLRAAAEAAAKDPQEAIKLYGEVMNDSSVDTAFQDLARLRLASLQMQSMSYPKLKELLDPATAAGRTFTHSARELLALSAWRANDIAATRQWIDMITNDAETPSSLRTRVESLQALLPPAAKS